MRHFAATQGGTYVLRFPDYALPKKVSMSVTNAIQASDTMLMGVSFDGSLNAGAHLIAGYAEGDVASWSSTDSRWQYVRKIRQGASLDEVKASGGDVLWQDRANNLVWIKVQGGTPSPTVYDQAANMQETFQQALLPRRLSVFAQ